MRIQEKKYTDEALKLVQDNLAALGFEETAKIIGATTQGLKKAITNWRAQGFEIPYLRRVPVGTVSVRNDKGVLRTFIKTETGWQRADRISPAKPKVKASKRKKQAAATKPCNDYARMKRAPKPEVKRLPTRVIDMSQHRYEKINNKTYVLRKIAS